MSNTVTNDSTETIEHYLRRHIRFGWAQVFCFLLLGLLLEAMHGFKVGWYLNAGEETRRLLLTLGHAHGVLLGVVNVAFGATLHALSDLDPQTFRLSSPLLLCASILLPAGFVLGGLVTYGGDPGFGIFLVAPGAAALILAIALIARATFRSR